MSETHDQGEIIKKKYEGNDYLSGFDLKMWALVQEVLLRWNTYWGVSLKNGNGENVLGKLLMKVREEKKIIRKAFKSRKDMI